MEREEQILRKRRKRRRRKIWLTVILSLLLIIALAALIIWKVFTVQAVVVEGNEHYTDDQIERFVLSDDYSWNSLYVLLKYRFLNVEAVPFVDTMEVSLKDPHTLQVDVYEKGIIGYLYISAIGQNAYFDTEGFVVETSKEIVENIPQVEGLDCDKVVLYEKILRSLLTVTQALKKNDVVSRKVQFNETGEISLDYGTVQVLLGGQENLTQKILRLSYILPELSGKTGTLHVENWTENTTDIIFDETT